MMAITSTAEIANLTIRKKGPSILFFPLLPVHLVQFPVDSINFLPFREEVQLVGHLWPKEEDGLLFNADGRNGAASRFTERRVG